MPKKLKVGVLMGGPSAERKVSLITGRAVYDNLDRKKYLPSILEMDQQGRIFLIAGKRRLPIDFQFKDRRRFDIIFIALHGTPGEDGTVQGMFDLWGIPYTGPGALSSATAMDKVRSGELYRLHGLPHPAFIHFDKNEWKKNNQNILVQIKKITGYPAVIKPSDQGSAVGVSIIKTPAELKKAADKTIKKFPRLMVQRFIKGREATCGVLEKNGQPFALPPTRIIPNLGEFYDYKSKYAAGGSTHLCPADFPPGINRQIQALALKAHIALGCRGMSRTDVFVGNEGKLWVIETNTIPGMTPTSLLPEAAGKAGINFSGMLDLIIKSSLSYAL